jgi:hypothetical protein
MAAVFHTAYLAIVKGSVYGQIVYVRVEDCGHLRLLNRADLAMRVHDKHRHIFLPAQAIDGRRSCVSAGGADDGQVLPVPPDLAHVPAHQEVLEQVAQKLQRDILERKGRAVEELQQMYVLLLVERHRRRDIFGAEGGIASSDNVLEVCSGYFGGRDVEGEDFVCEVLEGQVLPRGGPVAGKYGDLFGDEQPAVRGETLEDDVLEGELKVSIVCNGRCGEQLTS